MSENPTTPNPRVDVIAFTEDGMLLEFSDPRHLAAGVSETSRIEISNEGPFGDWIEGVQEALSTMVTEFFADLRDVALQAANVPLSPELASRNLDTDPREQTEEPVSEWEQRWPEPSIEESVQRARQS